MRGVSPLLLLGESSFQTKFSHFLVRPEVSFRCRETGYLRSPVRIIRHGEDGGGVCGGGEWEGFLVFSSHRDSGQHNFPYRLNISANRLQRQLRTRDLSLCSVHLIVTYLRSRS